MANQTDKEAASVHGTNPQNLIEYIARQKIYDSLYWKQECFGLSAERIVDKGVELRYIGGMFGEPQKPTEFICLLLKMLQIQPDKEIIVEFIKNDDFKYLRLLGAFYLRLVGRAVDVYQYLEPLLNDYRRVRTREPSGTFALNHIDELVDQMLRSDYLFNIALPRLPARHMLEKVGQLEPRISVLEDEFNAAVLKEQEEEAIKKAEAAKEEEAARKAAPPRRRDDDDGGTGVGRRKEKWRLGRDDDRRRDTRGRSRSRSRSRDRYHRRRRSRSKSRDRSRSRDMRGRDDRRSERDRSRERGGGRDSRRRGRDRDISRRDEEYAPNKRDGKRPRGEDNNKGKEEGEVEEGGGGGKDSLSVDATNKLRAQLGLPPLK